MVKVVEKKINNETEYLDMMNNSSSCSFRCIETGEIISDKNKKPYNTNMKTFHKMVNFNEL